MKAVVANFSQEKALVGAFSVIVQPVVELMDRFTALLLVPSIKQRRRRVGFVYRLTTFHLIYVRIAELSSDSSENFLRAYILIIDESMKYTAKYWWHSNVTYKRQRQ